MPGDWFPYDLGERFLARRPERLTHRQALLFELVDRARDEILNRGPLSDNSVESELAYDLAKLLDIRNHHDALAAAIDVRNLMSPEAAARYRHRARRRYQSELTYRVLGLLREWQAHSNFVSDEDLILTTYEEADIQ